jgi:HlyD family secretion protein
MLENRYSVKKQAPKRKRGGWIALAAVLVLAAAGGAGWYFFWGPGSAKAQAAKTSASSSTLHTTTVKRGNLVIAAAGTGTLVASQSVDLSFSTSGTVLELDVKAGDKVKAGQTLAKLGNTEALQASLASAKLQLLKNQQSLTSLQQNGNLALATAYQAWVKAQDSYNTAVFNEQRTAYARCSQATNTQLAARVDTYARTLSDLGVSQSGSPQWIAAEGNYETALANYNYCISYSDQEKANAKASVTVAQQSLQQAENSYNTLKDASGIDPNQLALAEATVEQSKTQLAQAQKNLDGVVLTAPFDGTILSVAASKGAMVGTATFITIADLSKPTIAASIDEADVSKLVVGSQATVTFDALPEQTFNGKVTQVNPQLTKSGNYLVATGQIELDDAAAKALANLPLGMTATIQVINKQSSNTLLVPVSALRDLGSGEYAVFVVGGNGKLQLTPVKVGLSDTANAEILSGLQAGQTVSTGVAQTK